MDGMWISDVLDLVAFFKGWFVKLSRSKIFVVFLFGFVGDAVQAQF